VYVKRKTLPTKHKALGSVPSSKKRKKTKTKTKTKNKNENVSDFFLLYATVIFRPRKLRV